MGSNVVCLDCFTTSHTHGFHKSEEDAKREAVKVWNTRPIEAALQSRIAELTMPEDVRETLLDICNSASISLVSVMSFPYRNHVDYLKYIAEANEYKHALDWLQKGVK